MTTIGLVANDQLLVVNLKPKISSGDQNTVKVHVDFSDEWDGFGKSAVFFTARDRDTVYEKVLTSGECIIPAEVMLESGTLYIGIRGVNSSRSEVKTTSIIKYNISEGTPTSNATEVKPTPNIYQQLLTAYGKTNDAIAVERARINQLISLPDGSTTADAELIDIRVGYDGTAYPSAGDAVRGQITASNAKVDSFGGSATFDVNGALKNFTKNTSIGAGFATGDTDIVTAYINYDVTKIGSGSFVNCTNLKTVYINNTSDKIIVESNAFPDGVNLIYNNDDDFINVNYFLAKSITDIAKDVTNQFSELKGDLDKLNDGGLHLKDEIIEKDVHNWLNKHPEATTTVQDGVITEAKINSDFLYNIKNSYVTPEMFGAVGDGITDDTIAFQNAIDYATSTQLFAEIRVSNKRYLVSSLQLKSGTKIVGHNNDSVTQRHGCIIFIGDVAFSYTSKTEAVIIKNVTLVGNGSNTLIDNNTDQLRFTKFCDVDINSFGVAFKDVVLFLAVWERVNINYCLSIGRLRGTDNFISTGYWGIIKDGKTYGLELNMNLSVIENIYFTFCTKDKIGSEYAIFFNDCKSLLLSKCLFTQSKKAFVYNTSTVSFSNSIFHSLTMDETSNVLNEFNGETSVIFDNIIYNLPQNVEFASGGVKSKIEVISGININNTEFTIGNYLGYFNANNPFNFTKKCTIGTTNGKVSFLKSFINIIELKGYNSAITELELNNAININGLEIYVYANGSGSEYSFMGTPIQNGTMKRFKYIFNKWIPIT